MRNQILNKVKEAALGIREHCTLKPRVGIILGTGLGGLVEDIEIEAGISYDDIPHFPVSTVESHSGRLIFGKLNGKEVVVMQGRFHYYEGYTMSEVVFPVRVMKELGIEKLFISNAAGSLNADFPVGELMLINDHIDLTSSNPLIGPNIDSYGVRFPDMSEPYDLKLIEKAFELAEEYSIPVHQGVYASVTGPNLETKAEYRFLQIIGADAVGMSTVPEVIVARHMEIPVFAVSVLTDNCVPENVKKVSLEEIIKIAAKAEPLMTKLIREMIGQLDMP